MIAQVLLTIVCISFLFNLVEAKNKDNFFLSKCQCKAAYIKPECDFSKLSKSKLRDLVEKLQSFQLTCVSADGINLPSFTMAMNPMPFSTSPQASTTTTTSSSSTAKKSDKSETKEKPPKKADTKQNNKKTATVTEVLGKKQKKAAASGVTGELEEDDEDDDEDEDDEDDNSSNTNRNTQQKDIKPKDVQTLLQQPGAEQQHCLSVQQALYHHSPNLLQDTIDQWDRLLPVILKTQLARHEPLPPRPRYRAQEQEFPLNHERFHFLGPVFHEVCKNTIEQYGEGDEEKRACGLQTLQYLHQIKDECIVYSIGSGDKWMFEEDIVLKTNCKIHTFDCVIPANTKPPKHLQDRVFFHPVCLSDRKYISEKGEVFVTWTDLHELTGTKVSPSFLKMDIEGYEFPVLRSIIESGTQLPLQIAAEIHIIRWENGIPVYDRLVPTAEMLSFSNYLRKFGGYYIIDRRDNIYCATCVEVILAKLDCNNHPNRDEEFSLLLNTDHVKFKAMVTDSLQAVYYT